MSGSSAESQPCCYDARAFHHAGFDHVPDMYAESGDLAHGSQAGFETFVCLLHCDYCFLDVVLEHPVVVVFGEVAGKMQVRVDEAGHDRLAGDVHDVISLAFGDVARGSCINDLSVTDQNETVFYSCSSGAVYEKSSCKCCFTHTCSPFKYLSIKDRH